MPVIKLRHLPRRLADGEAVADLVFDGGRRLSHGSHSGNERICTLLPEAGDAIQGV
jgi:hypothetical protein